MPAPGFEAYGEPTSYHGKSTGKHDSCSPSEEKSVKVRHHGYQGPNIDLENLEWRSISGPFVSIWLHNVPWGGEETMAAPDAKVKVICSQHEFISLFLSPFLVLLCCKISILLNQMPTLHLLSLSLSLSLLHFH